MPGKWKFSILALVNTDISSQRPVSDCCKQRNEYYWIKKFCSWALKVCFPLQLNKTNPPKTLLRLLNCNIWKAVQMTNKLLWNSYEILFHPLRNHSNIHINMMIIKKNFKSEVNNNILQALIFMVWILLSNLGTEKYCRVFILTISLQWLEAIKNWRFLWRKMDWWSPRPNQETKLFCKC